jgi:tetratricopeptide (TPR) repeat protein
LFLAEGRKRWLTDGKNINTRFRKPPKPNNGPAKKPAPHSTNSKPSASVSPMRGPVPFRIGDFSTTAMKWSSLLTGIFRGMIDNLKTHSRRYGPTRLSWSLAAVENKILKRGVIIVGLCTAAVTTYADKKAVFEVGVRFKGNSAIYLNRGSDLLGKGDLKGARANFDAAIRADPNIWPAYLDRAMVSAREDKWRAALEDCDIALRLRPGFFRTSIVRASIYQHLHRDRDSLADLDLVFSLHADDETDAVALSERSKLRATSADRSVRNPKAAVSDALRACRLNYWQKASYIHGLAAAYAASGDFDSAIRYEKQAIDSGKLRPDELQEAKASLARYSHRQSPGTSSY